MLCGDQLVNKQMDNPFLHTLQADEHSRGVAQSQLTDLQTRYQVNLTQPEMSSIISRASSPRQNDQQTRAKVADLFAAALRERGDPASLSLANQIAGARIEPQAHPATAENQLVTVTCRMGNRTFEISTNDPDLAAAARRANDPSTPNAQAQEIRNRIWMQTDLLDQSTTIREVTPGQAGTVAAERFNTIRRNYEHSGFPMSVVSVSAGQRSGID